MHKIDHMLWEELRLEEGEGRFSNLMGVTPAFGGKHLDMGTHNSLLSLGAETYLEIISLDPAHPKGADVPKEVPGFTPRLFAFAVRSHDLVLVERLATVVGLTVSHSHISRQISDGTLLEWKTAAVEKHEFGSFVPFFVRFDGVLHPAKTAPQGCELLEFSVGHPRHQELSRLYAALKIDVPVFKSESPLLLAVLRTPKGVVTLNSSEGVQVR